MVALDARRRLLHPAPGGAAARSRSATGAGSASVAIGSLCGRPADRARRSRVQRPRHRRDGLRPLARPHERRQHAAERPRPADPDRERADDLLGARDQRVGAPQVRRRGRRARSPRRSCSTATQAAQGKHAHGYVHQTLADLGLLGLGVSLVALVAWLLAAGVTLGFCGQPARSRRGRRNARGFSLSRSSRSCSGCTRRSTGPGSCPPSRSPAFSPPGWVAGRGPIAEPRTRCTRGHAAGARWREFSRRCRGRARRSTGALAVAASASSRFGRPHLARGERAVALGAARATTRCLSPPRATSRPHARPPTAPRTSTRSRSTPTSSAR